MGKTEKAKKIGLTTKIFIALIAGAIFGIILCYLVPSGHVRDDIIVEGILYVIGQGFIRLMKMLVVPLVFCSLVCAEHHPGQSGQLSSQRQHAADHRFRADHRRDIGQTGRSG